MAIKKYNGRDITLAAMLKVHYFPYLEHSNAPSTGEGNSQPEKGGYRRNRFLYQYFKRDVLPHAGQRFDHIFQGKAKEAADTRLYRIFFMGNSLAYGFGIDPHERYYSLLEKDLNERGQVSVIPAAVSAINSTQENVLFHLAVLPQKPDFVVTINGWNDVMMPAIFSLRPGDPMTMSALYGKYDQVFFNLVMRVCKRSTLASRFVTRLLERDRKDFLKTFRSDNVFRESLSRSIVNVYMQNLETVAEGCRLRGIKFLHILQPSGDVLWERYEDRFPPPVRDEFQKRMNDYPWAALNLGPFITEIYGKIKSEIAKRPWAADSHDPIEALSLDHFTDPVHLNPAGQSVLACELKKIIEPRIEYKEKTA
ncbi:MAG: SGNH/GDSL hydrolase family protein [Bdellovibrionia bacterium]